MTPFRLISSPAVLLPRDNVDTDQIIPARFLKTTPRHGLGKHLLHDWRILPDGSPRPECPLHAPGIESVQVLVAGDNFGCGSSREHAVWALMEFGFRCVISTRFGDIFQQNALKNGLLPVVAPKPFHDDCCRRLAEAPGTLIRVDLAAQRVAVENGPAADFPLDVFSKHCLLEGLDELDYLLENAGAIREFEQNRDGSIDTLRFLPRPGGAESFRL